MIERRTNFACRSRPPIRWIIGSVWLLILVCWFGAGWMLVDIHELKQEIAAFEGHVVRLQDAVVAQEDTAAAAPDASSIARLASRVDYYNSLGGQRSIPVMQVLNLLEGQVPHDVRLSKLSYDEERGRLAISMQTGNEIELPSTLERLERIPAFRSVILQRQLRLQLGERSLLQFEIEAMTK